MATFKPREMYSATKMHVDIVNRLCTGDPERKKRNLLNVIHRSEKGTRVSLLPSLEAERFGKSIRNLTH